MAPGAETLRLWFEWTTREERLVFAGILAIFLIGLSVRWLHLFHAKPQHLTPKQVEQLMAGDSHE